MFLHFALQTQLNSLHETVAETPTWNMKFTFSSSLAPPRMLQYKISPVSSVVSVSPDSGHS